MELKKIILPFILVFILIACKKPYERSCLKTKGDERSIITHFNKNADSLILYGDLIYKLIQDSTKAGEIEISGGKNLIPFVDIESSAKYLTIKNKNKCKFLRSYKNRIYVNIYIGPVAFIQYLGTRTLSCSDTLRSSQLRFVMNDGNGFANLIVKNNHTEAAVTNGFGNFVISGKSKATYLFCSSNSYCDARKLISEQVVNVNSETAGTMKVNATNIALEAIIKRNGNVEYIGQPTTISLTKKGSGKLIPIIK